MIRYIIPILGRDGSRRRVIAFDTTAYVVPRIEDKVVVHADLIVSVAEVLFSPAALQYAATVRCSAVFVETEADVTEEVRKATAEGWRVVV